MGGDCNEFIPREIEKERKRQRERGRRYNEENVEGKVKAYCNNFSLHMNECFAPTQTHM